MNEEKFEYYNGLTNPFIHLTTKIDITNIYKYCNEFKNLYATIGYVIISAINKIDEFKYRYENNEIKKYNTISISFTDITDGKKAGYFDVEFTDDYKEFINRYKYEQRRFKEAGESISTERNDIIWVSCLPWFKFSSLISPFDKENNNTQFIWDKVEEENNKFYINLMIQTHHGFTDGYHIKLLLDEISKIEKTFNIQKI